MFYTSQVSYPLWVCLFMWQFVQYISLFGYNLYFPRPNTIGQWADEGIKGWCQVILITNAVSIFSTKCTWVVL